PADSTVTRFTDLGTPNEAGYPHRWVQTAYDRGITQGTNAGGTLFAPWEPIRRDQLAGMIVRGAKEVMTGALEEPPAGAPSLFGGVGDPHGDNLRIAEYNGLLEGLLDADAVDGPDPAGTEWDVMLPATRGEVAQMLYNLKLKL
ncbi:MAG: S-layer homology domain-containing protein, partial [Thermoleophilia bacterium]|nr:S-layer homology domain-containing protein [Thermoleophilia bacterium]